MDLIVALASILIVLLVQKHIFLKYNFSNLTCSREFSRSAAMVGEELEMVETIKNRKPLPVPWLRIEAEISRHLQFMHVADRAITGEKYHKSVFFIMPFSTVRRRHAIICKKRGVYSFKSISLTAGDMFGIGRGMKDQPISAELLVYPKILDDVQMGEDSSRWQGEVVVKRWIVTDPFLVAGIRPYQAGDAQRDIHWAATARTGELHVKQRDYTADPRLLIVLNILPGETHYGMHTEKQQDDMEKALEIAATIAVRALDSGAEVGYACNGTLHGDINGDEIIYVKPARSFDQHERVLSEMARTTFNVRLSIHTFLEEIISLNLVDTDVLLLTFYMNDDISQRLRAFESMGNTVRVHKPVQYEVV